MHGVGEMVGGVPCRLEPTLCVNVLLVTVLVSLHSRLSSTTVDLSGVRKKRRGKVSNMNTLVDS